VAAAKRGGRGPSRRRPAAIYWREELCVADVFLKRKKQLEIFLSSPGRLLLLVLCWCASSSLTTRRLPFFLVLSKKMVLPPFLVFCLL